MSKLESFSLLLLAGLVLVSCSSTTGQTSSSPSSSVTTTTLSGSGSTGGTTPPGVSASAPLAISVATNYDTQSYLEQQTFAETSTTTCAASTTTPSATCTLNIPEGQLYFSSLNFQISWLPSQCKLLEFHPYYYRISAQPLMIANSATTTISNPNAYVPVNPTGGAATAIECMVNPTAACWGGVAPEVVPGFPLFTSLIFFPDDSLPSTTAQSKTVTKKSAYSAAWRSNRVTVNDFPIGRRGTAIAQLLGGVGEPYAGTEYVDYSFTCRDSYADPVNYTIYLNINDVDSAVGNGPIDNYFTWKEQ